MTAKSIFFFYLIVTILAISNACTDDEYPCKDGGLLGGTKCEPFKKPGEKCGGDASPDNLLAVYLGGKVPNLLKDLGLCHPTAKCIDGICQVLDL
ncbi:hypothetical protein Trydic_g20253 [Trypoxylus dichotomus]